MKIVFITEIYIYDMLDLELFDDIEYKYVKNIIEKECLEIDIYIEDLGQDELGYCNIRFTFEIPYDKIDEKVISKKFVVEKKYLCSDDYAKKINNLYCEIDEEDD